MGSRPNSNASEYGIAAIALVVIALWLGFWLWPRPRIRHALPSSIVQQSHAIGIALYSYANDNDGKYPTGKSSTEAFQQLLDGEYVTDPSIFYIPMPGKIRAATGAKLRPENVCFDLTSGLTTNSPPSLPLLFSTGYRVTYAPGADAVPEIKPYPIYGPAPRTSGLWLGGTPLPSPVFGISVYYLNNSARFISLSTASAAGVIPHFVPPDLKPDGNTYQQLTPDGPLKP